ncbi:hypothetical protein EVAR_66699_1 [Eumeta japonica]|uniref:Uncharacterized protein n=1 Tax=Eumeta variegata TaxID=151549 RepID=A0A4C1ZMY6_EUMVA|nr:hypothetical protein EVAR_66699_1 [Eumeta japonica]
MTYGGMDQLTTSYGPPDLAIIKAPRDTDSPPTNCSLFLFLLPDDNSPSIGLVTAQDNLHRGAVPLYLRLPSHGGMNHLNSRSMDETSQRKLLLHVTVLRECGISLTDGVTSRTDDKTIHRPSWTFLDIEFGFSPSNVITSSKWIRDEKTNYLSNKRFKPSSRLVYLLIREAPVDAGPEAEHLFHVVGEAF